MSNNKQSMKIYTEEQVNRLKYWKNNAEEDYLTTPISVLKYISELEKLAPIELPSNEEIKDKSFNKFTQSNARTCFEEGAKWIIEKILN